ncbi:serine/threonine protein kinase [Dactylosporangium roseum]|uniref:non-specific serine/threonine protein kinase n=1 Tax=Dactylosporangium roseum TaxID=47989 RepID=A0ABY5YX56_9ACTN|nr:serine/threonine-protein kinase [Dactylosporangium roseum]UWZ33961.1 serine/threonine protein kinase [Dactylosporangium roseum]
MRFSPSHARPAMVAGLFALAVSGLVAAAGVLAPPHRAATAAPAQPAASGCAITGVAAKSAGDADRLRKELPGQPVHQLSGARLDGSSGWAVPDGHPVLVVDATAGAARAKVSAAAFGMRFDLPAADGAPAGRYVNKSQPPLFGAVTRTTEIVVEGEGCRATLLLTSGRSPFATAAGLIGLLLALAGGFLTVLVARRRTGDWTRRALLAAPLGLVAGGGEALVLHEAGVISPSSGLIWLGPVVGLGLALLLPLTRRRTGAVPAAGPEPFVPPTHVDLAGRTAESVFGGSDTVVVYRALDADGISRVLLKVPRPQFAADPLVRARLDRDGEVMRLLDDDNCLRLRDTTGAVLVTEDVDGAPLRQILDAGTRLTGEQALAVVAGAASGLIAVHRHGLVHRDVTPDNIYLDRSGRTVLANFALAVPGTAPAPAPEGSLEYLSPEQRRGQPLDARSDLFTLGAVLSRLMTGQVPVVAEDAPPQAGLDQLHPQLATLIERALSADPDGRPESAEAFLADLREAATAAYGPDWMTLGAATGAVLAPGGALAAASAAGAGVVTAGGGLGLLGAGEVGAGAIPAVAGLAPAATTTTVVTAGAGGATASGGGAGGILPPIVGAAAAVVVGVVVAVIPQAPATAANEVITEESAKVILRSTWDEVRGGTNSHVGTGAQPPVSTLLGIPGVKDGELTEIKIGVPAGQTTYPAYFLVTAQAKLPDGSIVYVYVRFTRASADEPWMMSELVQSKVAAEVPSPKINDDGSLPPPPELVADPAALSKRYVDWGQRVVDSKALGSDDVLVLGTTGGSYLASIPSFIGVTSGLFYNSLTWRQGSIVMQPVQLADGTVLVRFTATADRTLYNSPAPASRSCFTNNGPVYVSFGLPGFPTGYYREVEADWTVTVTAHIPTKGGTAAPGADPTKVTIDDSAVVPSNPRTKAC